MRIKFLLAAVGLAMASGAASAADLPLPPAPVAFGGWYLRGDIGFSNQSISNRDYYRYASLISLDQRTDFNSAGIFGAGVGYQFNGWLRADLTGEYRAKSNLNGTDRFIFSDAGTPTAGVDTYTGYKSEWLVLANAYADLGTWWGITPFIGAGVGTARVTIANFVDINPLTAGGGYADPASKWNFAWALHAGLAYKISPSLTLEMAYRYVDMGNGSTGTLVNFDGTTANQSMTFKHITSQDLRFGVRWALEPGYYAPPPLYTKG